MLAKLKRTTRPQKSNFLRSPISVSFLLAACNLRRCASGCAKDQSYLIFTLCNDVSTVHCFLRTLRKKNACAAEPPEVYQLYEKYQGARAGDEPRPAIGERSSGSSALRRARRPGVGGGPASHARSP